MAILVAIVVVILAMLIGSREPMVSLANAEIDQRKTSAEYIRALKANDPMAIELARARRARAHASSNVYFAESFPGSQRVRDAYDAAVKAERQAFAAETITERRAAADKAYSAFVDAQDALLDLLVGPDNEPTEAPVSPNDTRRCGIRNGIDRGNVDMKRGTPKQKRLLRYLETKGDEFRDHLAAAYPDDERTRRLQTWSGRVVPFSQRFDDFKGGWAQSQYYSGCISFSLDRMASVPRSLTRLLHEMAHFAMGQGVGHSKEFYECHRWFMKIASEELGWILEIRCREMCFASSKRNPCPKCVWQVPPARCNPSQSLCSPDHERFV